MQNRSHGPYARHDRAEREACARRGETLAPISPRDDAGLVASKEPQAATEVETPLQDRRLRPPNVRA